MIEALQRRAIIFQLQVILADFNVLGGLVRVPRLQHRFVFFRRGLALPWPEWAFDSICESLLELSPCAAAGGLVPGASPGKGGRSYLSSCGLGEGSLAPGVCVDVTGKGRAFVLVVTGAFACGCAGIRCGRWSRRGRGCAAGYGADRPGFPGPRRWASRQQQNAEEAVKPETI